MPAHPPGTARRRHRRRGFSLIDLLIAFAIFSLALVSALTIFPATMQSIRKARFKIMATHLTQTALESIVNYTFSNIVSTGPTTKTLTAIVNGTTESIAFTTTVTVTDLSATLKDVLVTVTWSEDGGKTTKTSKVETEVAAKP